MNIKEVFRKKWNKNLKHLPLILIAIFFFVFGYLFSNLSNSKVFSSASAFNSPFEMPKILQEVKSVLETNFIPWKTSYSFPSSEDLEYGIVKGYVESYKDPYTEFFTPSESKQFEENIKGSFGGIGALIGYKDKNVVIVSPLKDSPAEKAGIKSGDIIISVNSSSTEGMSADQVISLIRGEIGTEVILEVFHKDGIKTEKIKIVRQEIKVPILETETKDNVFIIHFYSFTEDSATRFEKVLQEFIKSGKTSLILDLRGNGGGYLDSAIDISSFFLAQDKVVVTEKSSKTSLDNKSYSRGYNYFAEKKIKLVVMIDGGSASASEIVAGALKDNGIAKVVGEKSFGKGSVQQLIKLSDGSDLKVTVAKWFTPLGVNISESGITPDFVATTSAKVLYDKNGKVIDTQLLKAISIIKTLK
ncbi:MAG: carboxy-terminal-processing protease, carboxyl-terminal processing protease [Candidatus Parcubacteria bacterium]|jgi:carboxyl-terminal processing protease